MSDTVGDMAVDAQLAASHEPWPVVREASLRAEADGYDALWVFDHLAGVALGGDRGLEAFTWLGALAEATSTIELGVLVANAWNRRVGTLAVAAASVAEIAGRPVHLGIGAGTSPTSRWAAEQHAVRHAVAADLATRHSRVEEVLDLTEQMWAPDRPDRLATFPRPASPPERIVGVNSVELSELAGRRADGVNVAWDHPRRDELLATARRAAGDRRFTLTAWTSWDPALRDPDHPVRRDMRAAGLDRVVLTLVGELRDFVNGP